jgi:hypothetical protein
VIRSIAIASCLALSCADPIVGVDPPGDEVFYPVGFATIPNETGAPAHLVVVSSNFDQRFNSGSLNAYFVDRLFEIATGCGEEICFTDSLREVQSGTIRVFSFGGELVYVQQSPGVGSLFVAARGRNRLTMVDVDTRGDRLFNCKSRDDLESVSGSDCSRAYVVSSGFADPFSLAYAPAPPDGSRPPLLAIGHVAQRQINEIIFGAVTLADLDRFRQRVVIEADTGDTAGAPEPVAGAPGTGDGGFSGVVYVGRALGEQDAFLVSNFRTAPELNLSTLTPRRFEEDRNEDTVSPDFELRPPPDGDEVRLTGELAATETRSLAVPTSTTGACGSRAFASVRFSAMGATFNSGLAVIDVPSDSTDLTVRSIVEMGEELQRPFLRETGDKCYAYVGDIRRDKIYIADVTGDRAFLVNEIDGRAKRTLEGEEVQVRLLDAPTQIEFVTYQGKTLGFVSNFANSTLAVLDVTDPDPRAHRIVARLGRNIDPDGEMEKP